MLIVSVAALSTTAVALAQGDQDPSASQYEAPVAATDVASEKEEPSGLDARIGKLPFTGLDLIVLGGVAFVITGTGFALHRLSAPRI